jgi:hypothetical protein
MLFFLREWMKREWMKSSFWIIPDPPNLMIHLLVREWMAILAFSMFGGLPVSFLAISHRGQTPHAPR